MKVAEVINVPWWNAAAEYCITIADAMSKRGHGVVILCEKGTPSYGKAVELNLQTNTMLDFRPTHLFSDLLSIRHAFRTMYSDVQLVNVHTSHAQTLFASARALFGLRYGLVRTRVDSRGIKRYPFNRLSYRSMDGIIVANRADQREVGSFAGLPDNLIRTIHAGVDTARFRQASDRPGKRQGFNIPRDVHVIGNIARRSPVKGHDVFFKSAQLIHNDVKDVFFVAAGVDDTVLLEDLRNMAEQAGVLEKTLFLDYVDDIEGLIGCLDVGIVSSIGSENHSRITLEYMACGVPVVGPDVGDIPELIDDRKTGFIVKPGDFVAMADAVIRLLKDRELREVFGYNARKLAEQRFSTSSFAEATEVFYMEVIGRKRYARRTSLESEGLSDNAEKGNEEDGAGRKA